MERWMCADCGLRLYPNVSSSCLFFAFAGAGEAGDSMPPGHLSHSDPSRTPITVAKTPSGVAIMSSTSTSNGASASLSVRYSTFFPLPFLPMILSRLDRPSAEGEATPLTVFRY